MALQDVKKAKLNSLGYSGSNPDMEKAFYATEAVSTLKQFNDLQYAFLASKGFTVGALQDRWRAYLLSLGYTGSFHDMLLLFWTNYTTGGGGTAVLLEDGFYILLEDGFKLLQE